MKIKTIQAKNKQQWSFIPSVGIVRDCCTYKWGLCFIWLCYACRFEFYAIHNKM